MESNINRRKALETIIFGGFTIASGTFITKWCISNEKKLRKRKKEHNELEKIMDIELKQYKTNIAFIKNGILCSIKPSGKGKKNIYSNDSKNITSLLWSQEGKGIYIVQNNNSIRLLDLDSGMISDIYKGRKSIGEIYLGNNNALYFKDEGEWRMINKGGESIKNCGVWMPKDLCDQSKSSDLKYNVRLCKNDSGEFSTLYITNKGNKIAKTIEGCIDYVTPAWQPKAHAY
jgi:WD40 repeat protein